DRIGQALDELGLDRTLDDRVTVVVDPLEMLPDRRVAERDDRHGPPLRFRARLPRPRSGRHQIRSMPMPARARISGMHVLDNPVWHELTGTHATVAERTGNAARYDPDVAVFAALTDGATRDAWDALGALVGPGGTANLARRDLAAPETWTVLFRAPCR